MTPLFIHKLPHKQKRLYMLLHYVDESKLFGFSIHRALKSQQESDWIEVLRLLKDQAECAGSARENVKNEIGEECFELLNQIKL